MKNVLWETFEISVNFFQGFILIFFSYSYLGDKKCRSFAKSPAPIYSVIIAVAMSILNRIMIFEHFYVLIYISILLLYSFTNLNGTWLSKVFTALFCNVIFSVITAFVANFSAVLFGTELYSILSENNIERFIAILAAQLMILYAVILTLKVFKGNKKSIDLFITEWILIASVLIISTVIGVLLNNISFEPDSHSSRISIVIIFIGVILINIVVCYIVIDLGNKNKAVRENEMLRLTQEYSRQYAKNAAIEYDVIRKFKHDFKDSFSVIHTLLKEKNVQRAVELIEDNINILDRIVTYVKTDNEVVNAVINAKLSTAKTLGIESTCISIMNFEGINDLDLCRLLTNMLENAVTACVESKAERKQISLKISVDEYKYSFVLKNTIDRAIISENPHLITSKNNKEEHGFGTQIIKDIALKYNGRSDFYEEDDYFCCCVTLKK